MIPKFPDFKKLELSDREDFEKFVSKFLPYSAFNFTYLWAWDLGEISELNGNLVVRFATDFKTMKPFLSFLGNNECESTMRTLLSFARSSELSPELRFIPGEVIKYLKSASLKMEEDRDNFDYLFSPTKLAEFQGNQFKELRRLARIFSEKYPEAVFQLKDLNDLSVQKKILLTLRKWEYRKKMQNKSYDLNFEERALCRLLENAKHHELILSCVFLHDEMIAFSIDEILPDGNAMAHFVKAINSFNGIYEFLNRELAKHLKTLNIVLWNWQQDLDIKNLRDTKLGYRPVAFLEMYTVSLNEDKDPDLQKIMQKAL